MEQQKPTSRFSRLYAEADLIRTMDALGFDSEQTGNVLSHTPHFNPLRANGMLGKLTDSIDRMSTRVLDTQTDIYLLGEKQRRRGNLLAFLLAVIALAIVIGTAFIATAPRVLRLP